MSDTPVIIIGRAEHISLPAYGLPRIPARIDTGAKTSAIWATGISEKDGVLEFCFFGKSSPLYTGAKIHTKSYGQRLVASSTGHVEQRYTVKLSVIIGGRRIQATFTLANRATQVYPVLIGRNILRGKFMVDVKLGTPLLKQEYQRELQKQAALRKSITKKGNT